MPSEDQVRAARAADRADGWGIIDGAPEREWLDLSPPHDKTLLESGQELKHHQLEMCSGNCCLHGTSTYASCRMPRQWRHDKQIIEHVCPHGVGHPCYAGIEYANAMGENIGGGVHGCDGCCVRVDNSPIDVDSILNEVDRYTLLHHDGQLEKLSEYLTQVQEDIEDLRRVSNTRFIWLNAGFIVLVFTFFLQLLLGK